VILCDTGPLFAILDKKQHDNHIKCTQALDKKQHDNHIKCTQALAQLDTPMITTWPCFTEAMYLAYRQSKNNRAGPAY
jgi:uncharacterized protein